MALTKVTSGVRTIASSEVVTASIADDAALFLSWDVDGDKSGILYDWPILVE